MLREPGPYNTAMALLLNLLWLIFGGLLSGLGYILGGMILCITIIGIPFGMQSIRLGLATLTPFGKEVREIENSGMFRLLFDVVWILLFGWEIALAHILSAAVLFVSIIGIPFALQHVKLVPVALFPFGKELR